MATGATDTLDSNTWLCRRANQDLFGAGLADVADEILSANFVSHAAPPEAGTGPESMKRTVAWLRSGLSEIDYEILDTIAQDDLVTLRVAMTALHDKPFLGHEPTGRRFRTEQMHIFRVANGMITEHWACRDDLGMMRQLGLVEH